MCHRAALASADITCKGAFEELLRRLLMVALHCILASFLKQRVCVFACGLLLLLLLLLLLMLLLLLLLLLLQLLLLLLLLLLQ